MSYRRESPFDNIESAEQFVKLLIEVIKESKHDVDAEATLAVNHSGRSKKALQLVSTNLAKLSQHMIISRRILNHLKTLRRLLLQEQRPDNSSQKRNGNRELSGWS